jgi:hypothetical protein
VKVRLPPYPSRPDVILPSLNYTPYSSSVHSSAIEDRESCIWLWSGARNIAFYKTVKTQIAHHHDQTPAIVARKTQLKMVHSPSDSGIKNVRDFFTSGDKEKISPELKRTLSLLQLSGLDSLEERFLATAAFLEPWAVFRDSIFLLQPDAMPRATMIATEEREDGVSRIHNSTKGCAATIHARTSIAWSTQQTQVCMV